MRAEGGFSVSRGSLRGVDLVEAVRRVSGAPVQGGVTSFEQLTGKMRLTMAGSRFYNLAMASGLMQSTGVLDVGENQAIRGVFDLQMRGSVNQSRVPISVGGTLKAPVVQLGRK